VLFGDAHERLLEHAEAGSMLKPVSSSSSVVLTGSSMRIFVGFDPAVKTSSPSSKARCITSRASTALPSKGTKACMAPSPERSPTAAGSRRARASKRRPTRRASTARRPPGPR
jgi:hypothetical protein